MTTVRLVEAFDVFENGQFHPAERLQEPAAKGFGLEGFLERFHRSVFKAIALAARREFEAVQPQELLLSLSVE